MTTLTLTDFPPELQAQTTNHVLTSGQILMQQGEAAKQLFWLQSGRMRLVSFIEDQIVTHYFVEAGEFFAETALHFDQYGCTAIAEVPSQAIAIPAESFATTLQQCPILSQRYLATLTQRFHSVKTLLELRTIRSARDRLKRYLFQHLPPGQSTIILEKPLKAIASELALTPESFSRLLARLQTEGVITRKQRSISLTGEWLDDVSDYYKLDPG